jgi:hypothetical protein
MLNRSFGSTESHSSSMSTELGEVTKSFDTETESIKIVPESVHRYVLGQIPGMHYVPYDASSFKQYRNRDIIYANMTSRSIELLMSRYSWAYDDFTSRLGPCIREVKFTNFYGILGTGFIDNLLTYTIKHRNEKHFQNATVIINKEVFSDDYGRYPDYSVVGEVVNGPVDRFIKYMNGRVLFDINGYWFAETAHAKNELGLYCMGPWKGGFNLPRFPMRVLQFRRDSISPNRVSDNEAIQRECCQRVIGDGRFVDGLTSSQNTFTYYVPHVIDGGSKQKVPISDGKQVATSNARTAGYLRAFIRS